MRQFAAFSLTHKQINEAQFMQDVVKAKLENNSITDLSPIVSTLK